VYFLQYILNINLTPSRHTKIMIIKPVLFAITNLIWTFITKSAMFFSWQIKQALDNTFLKFTGREIILRIFLVFSCFYFGLKGICLPQRRNSSADNSYSLNRKAKGMQLHIFWRALLARVLDRKLLGRPWLSSGTRNGHRDVF